MCKLYLTELELAKNKVSSLEKQFELSQRELEKTISQEKKVLSVLKGEPLNLFELVKNFLQEKNYLK